MNWSNMISAVVGLAGGALSGFFTAYVQLSTAEEKYSIARAQEFQNLMDRLSDEQTARLAILNLWQLYPEERDRKIIVAAAFAVGQPDLVELLNGIDEKLDPVADVMHARALSHDDKVSGPALDTLLRIDPVRGARVMISKLEKEIEDYGDSLLDRGNAPRFIIELSGLAERNPTVASMLRPAPGAKAGNPLLFDYILYFGKQESKFVGRLKEAYTTGKNLSNANTFLAHARFDREDGAQVVEAVTDYVAGTLERPDADEFLIVDVMVALKNPSLEDALKSAERQGFVELLSRVTSDTGRSELMRARALALLRKLDPQEALRHIARALGNGMASNELRFEIEDQINGGLFAELEHRDPSFSRPAHCGDEPIAACLDDRSAWQDWLTEVREADAHEGA